MTNDERAIRERVATRLSASRSGDLSTVLSLMTDDLTFLVAGQPLFGKKEFVERFTRPGTAKIEAASKIQEVCAAGNWAFLRSHISMTIAPAQAAKPVRGGVDTLSILRKESDGQWRLSRDANLVAEVK